MKISRLLLLALLAAAYSSVAFADGTSDPKMGPIGGGGSIILTSPNDPAFTFSYTAPNPANNTPGTPTVNCGLYGGSWKDTCINPKLTDFLNDSGETWTSITIDITASTGGLTFSCLNVPDPYFTTCTPETLANGTTALLFSGIDATHPGILSASCVNEEGDLNSECNCQVTTADDFSILTDVTGATAPGDSFTVQGTAGVPESSTLWLTLIGGVLLIFLKRP
jgi:hypothetical protein